MAATPHKLAVILRLLSTSSSSSDDGVFLLLKQRRLPKFGEEEYDSYLDSDLWDLPNCDLSKGSSGSGRIAWDDVGKVDLGLFDVDSALMKALEEVGLEIEDVEAWRFWKCVEEPNFGPGLPVTTVFVEGSVVSRNKGIPGVLHKHLLCLQPVDLVGEPCLAESCKWLSIKDCLDWLLKVKPGTDRVGIMAVLGVINDSMPQVKFQVPPTLGYQEYPLGVVNIPMGSKTAPPFSTTNLVVFASDNSSHDTMEDDFVAYGDALIVDPGCKSQHHEELGEIVAALPRKLVVFVTHHHGDHVAGLSVIQRCNPDAIILAHKNTVRRIHKDIGSLQCISLSRDEDVIIGGQRLRVLFAPGHTDGHMTLLDSSTNSLIVGDNCLGSAILDLDSGGNVADYYKTTYNFMDLSPHAIIPMHGRVNLWPKNLLCGYLRNRRKRENDILKAIEGGAKTLFDIVAVVYANVDRGMWYFASLNVRVHVEHLAQMEKLPKGFPMRKFQRSRLIFYVRWFWAYLDKKFGAKFGAKFGTVSMWTSIFAGVVLAGSVSLPVVKTISNDEKIK